MLAFCMYSNRHYWIICPRKWVRQLRLGAFAEWKSAKVFWGKLCELIKTFSLSSSVRSFVLVFQMVSHSINYLPFPLLLLSCSCVRLSSTSFASCYLSHYFTILHKGVVDGMKTNLVARYCTPNKQYRHITYIKLI